MGPAAGRWTAVGLVIALATTAQGFDLVAALRYDRNAITAGELWRVLTGHLVHLNGMHLALNAAGLALVNGLVGTHLRLPAWGLALVVSAATISAGLWLGAPQLSWYVGLSGVLHGLLAAGALAGLADRRERLFAGLVVAVIAAKLLWEQLAGATPGTGAVAGGRVVVDAHLYGAIGGLVAMALHTGWRRVSPGKRRSPGP